MLGFVPNINVLQYLEAAGKDEPELREKAIKHMKAGKSVAVVHVL